MQPDDPADPLPRPFILPRSALFGFKTIDHEHQELVDIVNGAIEDFRRLGRREAAHFEPWIRKLRERMVHHFAHEEREMRHAGFDGVAAHITHHTQLIERLNHMLAHIGHTAAVDIEALFELFAQVMDDILRADLPFKDYLAANGLIAPD
ncbi:MAG: hemerythrin family protein [Alphaproteobacteria bacterium]|nr:hemerythrin family protein [Alphaproteobacteria bacterium]MBU6471868.1 hemerythrin family protein [Alphaproteobacteria bacterium]MDE2013043.1 hemerythrin family protein [Alphaproteobacteria bacterium]MDE2073903.1 hemerythrin family protein [Alphaproteobacteria bacterium]MDE2351001.1 hemerythrin family protein [Alphaproteobacteria bacterium]